MGTVALFPIVKVWLWGGRSQVSEEQSHQVMWLSVNLVAETRPGLMAQILGRRPRLTGWYCSVFNTCL